MGIWVCCVSPKEDRQIIADALERIDMVIFAIDKSARLSGGPKNASFWRNDYTTG